MKNLIKELRRRKVFRVSGVYAGVTFILLQLVDIIFPMLMLPAWTQTFVLALLVIGFPVAVGLAWAFDITDDGIVRTKGKAESPTTTRPFISNTALGIVASLAILVAAWSWFSSGDNSPEIRSIAVLPLVNMMNDPDQDYFVDGMHEALTAELSKISALRVIGRTSTLSYKVNPKPIPEIAAELNVDAVIEGSVLLAGNKVRITAQLVAARPERHLWADDYVRDMEKILALHKDVAQAIVEEIRVTLTLKEEAILASARPVDPEAYKAYLKGRHFLERLSKEDHDRALDRFNQALNIDPNFAPAYAGIASVYSNLAVAYLPPSEAYPKAKEAAVKAIQLDERLAEAHLILSNILALWEWNWDESRRELDLALELNPNDATTHTYLAIYWLARGNPAEAVRFAQKAQELDPVSAMVSLTLESCYLFNKQYDDAIAQHEITQELSPGFFYLRSRRGIALLEKGLYKEAIRDFDEAERILGRPTTDKAIALARMGRMEEAWEVAREIEATFDNTYHSPVHLAELYVGLGDKERAYTWLNRAVEERAPIIHYLPVFPGFTTIREEQRFKEILKRVGLE